MRRAATWPAGNAGVCSVLIGTLVGVALLGTPCIADAQANSRKIRPAEQALLDRLAAEFAKLVPPTPSGWVEVQRTIYDAGGMVTDWDAPIQANYEVQFVVADIEERQKVVEARQQAAVDRAGSGLADAATANEKLMEEFAAKMEAAMKRNDQAGLKRIQEEFEKKMAAGAKAAAAPIVAAPELRDSYARIRLVVNPYSDGGHSAERKRPAPAGFTSAMRAEPDENRSDREGVTRYLLGKWKPSADSPGDYTLTFTPGQQAAVYGIVLEIEASAERAEALFRLISKTRLQALLQ